MASNLERDFWQALTSCSISERLKGTLLILIRNSDEEDRFSKPMPWIGIYIAVASLFCILAIVADLLHGVRSRKLWFPCKYITLNAASLTVMAVALKLPVDLNNPMRGYVDQSAKYGSTGFMCTMMANLLPSLATMDINQLFTNMIALGILVITVVVNVFIQINTGVVHSYSLGILLVAMLLMLLMIYTCSSLAILKSKQILESKYQAAHETPLKDHQPGRLSVDKLKKHVSNYWIMAETGSPQFMIACSVATSASGVICVFNTIIQIFLFLNNFRQLGRYDSNYKWSMFVILVIQCIGTVLGTIAPLFRCLATLGLKLSINWIWNHLKIFKVESYWTQKLSDWKHSIIPFPSRSRRWKIVIENLKTLSLNICIGFQKTVVVACKVIALLPILFVVCVWWCSRCWTWLKAIFSAFGIALVKERVPVQLEGNEDLSRYVLLIQDDMEIAKRTLKSISKSLNRLIQKAEKQQPNNLMELLAESRGFEGVGKYDSHHVPSLLGEEYLDCWSLPLVTLTTIAISLPKIQMNIVDRLLTGVSEGLVYVKFVEESPNAIDDYASIQKAAKMLWLEVEVYKSWLGNKLQKPSQKANTAAQIVQWFRDTSKIIVAEVERMDIGIRNDDIICRSISANSMYHITETILLSYDANTNQVNEEELFVQLSSMIPDILAACLTNLPRVIAMKCHANVIEKREASVHAATQLLGETTQIIKSFQDCQLPSLNPDDMLFIEKWRAYYQHPSP